MITRTDLDFTHDLDLSSFLSSDKEWQGYAPNDDQLFRNLNTLHSTQQKNDRSENNLSYTGLMTSPKEKVHYHKAYFDKTYSDKTFIDKTYSDKSYSHKVYLNNSYSDRTLSDKTFSDVLYSDKSYFDKAFSDKSCSDETFLDKSYSNKTFSDKSYSNKTYSDNSYSDLIWKDFEDYCGNMISISEEESLRSQEFHTPSLIDEYSDCDISPKSDLFCPTFEDAYVKPNLPPPPYESIVKSERPPPSYEEVCAKKAKANNDIQKTDIFAAACEEISLSSDPFSVLEITSPKPEPVNAFETLSSTTQNDIRETFPVAKESPKTNDVPSYQSFPPSIYFDSEELSVLGRVVNFNDVLKPKSSNDNYEYSYPNTLESTVEPESPIDPPSYESIPTYHSKNFDESQLEAPSDDSRKGKITGLQRIALDSVFSVIDRPSRGLVQHIATELNLHHITVKNFFSNGRRRLRRAAARINDPERTRRENLRRKEKRRLAALAAAAAAFKEKEGTSTIVQKETVISPQRKALMEKLAVKIQRSAAQRNLSANNEPLEHSSIGNFQETSDVHSTCTKKSFQTVTFPQSEYVEENKKMSSYANFSPSFGMFPEQDCLDFLTCDQNGPFSSSSVHSLVYS